MITEEYLNDLFKPLDGHIEKLTGKKPEPFHFEDEPDRLELDKQEILDKIKELEDLVKNLR